MTQFVPSEDSGLLPADVDLGQIFIGREHQLELFHIRLEHWRHEMLMAPDIQVTAAPSPNNKIQGLVVLLFGRGGFGKSTLLKHYREIALQDSRKVIVSGIVDWEHAIEGKRSLFNPASDREVDASEYFRFLCSQLAEALKKRPDEFKEYQAAVKAVEEARKQATGVLDSVQKDDRYASLRMLAGPGAITLLSWIAPRVGQALDSAKVTEKVEEVIGQGAQIGAEQLVHAYSKLHDRLGHKLDDYLEPALRLGLALGRDLSRFAKNFPLLIFFDTYEEVDEADRLLRLVMGAAGARVGWVLAGRDNLWAGSEQRKRSIGKVYGYKEIVPPGLVLAIDFNAGGVGAFTASDIVEYFSLLHQQVSAQLALPVVTEEDAELILEVTQGVPLAVRIAAGLYLESADLAIITEKADGKREIVDEMVQRYLLHTRDDQPERMRLYGLAMLRRADHPAAIAAALGLSPEQARTSYETELSRLQRRYSFIFIEKAQPLLHQEVSYFLRLWLLERRNQPEIMAVNERLKQAHETALKELEDQRQYGSVRERLEDEEWVGVYLNLAEQQFWLDPAEGVHYSLPFMLAAAIYRRDANLDAADVGEFFKEDIKQPYRNWWKWADQSLIYNQSRNPSDEELAGLVELAKLASQRCPTFPQPLPDCRKELEAALWWRLGEAYEGKDDNKTLEWYEKALERLGQETELREAAAETYSNVADKLYEEKKHAEGIPFLDRAIELKPDYAYAYNSRGFAYWNLGEYEHAIVDYDHAIELDPKDVFAYSYRGNAYKDLKEYERAIADYDRAIELDPKYAKAYYNRGLAYLFLKNTEQARTDYTRSYELNPIDVDAAWMAEWAGMGKQRPGTEIAKRLEDIATIDPQHYVARVCKGVTLGLRGKLKDGLAELEQAILLDLESWDAYFWKGMLCAYFYPGRNLATTEALEKALEVDLPPVLLTPLYWLEKDEPGFFKKYAAPLLARYEV
jgi:tetratricopeptide (TPR) repeat protein